jgi:hypothetical protein
MYDYKKDIENWEMKHGKGVYYDLAKPSKMIIKWVYKNGKRK